MEQISVMASLDKVRLKQNILRLLDFSGLTDISFAFALNISDKQIKRIKKGEAEFTIDNINKASELFNKSIEELNTTDITYSTGFRVMLMEFHANNTEYIKLLTDKPSLTYAIKYELVLGGNIPKEGITVDKIGKFFDSLNWHYSSAYISLGMARNAHLFDKLENPFRKGSYLYKEKES